MTAGNRYIIATHKVKNLYYTVYKKLPWKQIIKHRLTWNGRNLRNGVGLPWIKAPPQVKSELHY